MDADANKDLIQTAQEYFNTGKYSQAESILNQLILKNCKDAQIFQMLGTIYYDQGKFNKAIRAFKRALEINPGFTDASIGLSIIFNDLGRYEDGKRVFEEAQQNLVRSSTGRDPMINEKLALKHDELGELYFQYKRYEEALEQFYKALGLSTRKPEITLKIVESQLQLNAKHKAIKELQNLLTEYPQFHSARIKLGKVYFSNSQAHLARQQWEEILRQSPDHAAARKLISLLDDGEGAAELSL